MDYFYVGNHGNNVGLLDLYAKAKVNLNQKTDLDMALHHFSAASDIGQNTSQQLGMELDLVYAYALAENISISGGYSHLFASEGMETLKNNFDGNTNNWAWVMVSIKPTLFQGAD